MAGVWLLAVCCLLTSVSHISGKYAEGSIVSLKGWVFLDSFLFPAGDGASFKYNISYPRQYAPLQLLFYGGDQFAQANDPFKSCQQKIALLQYPSYSGQVLSLDTTKPSSGCYNRYDAFKGDYVFCVGRFNIDIDSSSGWFVTANRCGDQNGFTGLYLQYRIESIGGLDDIFPFHSGQGQVTLPVLTLMIMATFGQFVV
ncbi:uncharacterized protein LOC124253655 [Haliotis rubra]|uniref:uncharacterized protein LOC124253655 n=1 Tax=Haliotis rubra TaxID=36100 RepID=UPI001EE5C26C|nr:uncharacterized protein LOC124253655 [Haliotis rubra]